MIYISDLAKEKLIAILIEESCPFMRFALQGGGCNGFQYSLAIENSKENDDTDVFLDGLHTLLVDSASMMYLQNATIDYKKDIMGESFVFNSPDQKSTCGCSKSVTFN